MIAYRCPKCGKLLFKSDAPQGNVQVPCQRCGAIRLVVVGPRPVVQAARA